MHLKLLVKHLLSYRSNLIDFDHSLCINALFLPFIEAITHVGGYEMSKHDLLLFLDNFVSVDLPPDMAIVLQESAPVNLSQDISNVAR